VIATVTAATVISYTLYTLDPNTVSRFHSRALFWTVPMVFYGIFRYLYSVHKLGKGGDPVRIFLSDKMMIANSILWVITSTAIVYLKV
jgi:hypothetical protein